MIKDIVNAFRGPQLESTYVASHVERLAGASNEHLTIEISADPSTVAELQRILSKVAYQYLANRVTPIVEENQ